MKKQVQSTGERDWYGDQILIPQDEIWKVLEKWLGQYDQPCILSGCTVTPNGGNWDVAAGILLLKDPTGNYQFCEFAGALNIALPQYFYVTTTVTNALYYDTNLKPIQNAYTASYQAGVPSSGYYLLFQSSGTPLWKDIVQDSTHRMVSDAQITAWTSNIAVVSGMIMIWPAAAIPAGWLECDGSAISRAANALLFTAIGTTYGAGDGSTTFNIPDLRGEFVRGYDNGKGVDVGRALGSSQADAIKQTTITGGGANASWTSTSPDGKLIDPSNKSGNFSITIPGGTETVPKNVAMKFIIKK